LDARCDAADLLGDVAAEQAAERVADRARCLRRQRAGEVEGSVSGVASDSTSWAPVAEIAARGRPADVGILQHLRRRLSALPAKLRGAARSAASPNRG